ncbi:MAG: citrate lyase ligase [Anaeromyxobacter sp.]|nr:citrate lyase ligase [Anaeromyxobacter sp.]MBL0275535.1 citrate lyase ligase [Anaeromyxobacter sp.]
MVVDLMGGADRARARAFVEAQGLRFEEPLDDLMGAFEDGALVATGARTGDVLKLIALDPAHQGAGLLGEVVGALVTRGLAAGHQGLFVFTRPEHAQSFEALTFSLLASHATVALLEYGRRFEAWLAACGPLRRPPAPGGAGAVVMNCNPFTLGHQWLVEQAAARVETLYLFVVREDRSAFPFEVRDRLVRAGTRHLPNVVVLDTSRYAVSALTFPSYFLAKGAPVEAIQLELDLALFGQRVAPAFGVTRRFFGSEPTCPTTRAYNGAMLRLLPVYGVEPVELPRLEAGGGPISASTVRAALLRGDDAALKVLVPGTTLAYLRSPEGRALAARLGHTQGSTG